MFCNIGYTVQPILQATFGYIKTEKIMYHYIVKKLVKKSFGLVNERRFTELVKGMALNVRHSFAGDHALGGVRNDQAAVKVWMERLGRVMPNLQIKINRINLKGWPNNTLAIVRTATATLENGDSYLNKGVHFITLKWGKVTELDVYEDSLVVYNGLQKQYASGSQGTSNHQLNASDFYLQTALLFLVSLIVYFKKFLFQNILNPQS
jgi:ketosteroid isomerase-like protein